MATSAYFNAGEDASALNEWAEWAENELGILSALEIDEGFNYRREIALQMALQTYTPTLVFCFMTDGMFTAYPPLLMAHDEEYILGPITAVFAFWGAEVKTFDPLVTQAGEALALDPEGSQETADARIRYALQKVNSNTRTVLSALAHRHLIEYYESYIPPQVIDLVTFAAVFSSPEFADYCERVNRQNTIYPR